MHQQDPRDNAAQNGKDLASAEKSLLANAVSLSDLTFEKEFEESIKPDLQKCIAMAMTALYRVYGRGHQIPKNAAVQLGLSIYNKFNEHAEIELEDLQTLANKSVRLAAEALNLKKGNTPSIEYVLRENLEAVAVLANLFLLCFSDDMTLDEIDKEVVKSPYSDGDDSMDDLEVGGHHRNLPQIDSLDEAWATFAHDAMNETSSGEKKSFIERVLPDGKALFEAGLKQTTPPPKFKSEFGEP